VAALRGYGELVLRPTTRDLLLVRLAEEQSRCRLPSVVAGLVRDGELVWSAGRGRIGGGGGGDAHPAGGTAPDADTQYRCGSISKTFVAVAVLRLRDEGLFSLQDPIARHLPDAGVGDATIGQLLSHSAGLRAETAGPWWERTPGGSFDDLVAGSLGDAAQVSPAGVRFHYSNVGFAVLGELLTRLRGAPLGMARTTTRPSPPHATGFAVHPWADVVLAEPEHDAGAMAPAGQLWSTVHDLGRWAGFLAGDIAGPLSPDTLAEMRLPRVVDDRPGQPWTVAYGLGLQLWNAGGRRMFGHGGSMPGFLASLQIEALGPHHTAVITLTNTTSGVGPSLPADLLDLVAEHEPAPAAEWVPAEIGADVLEIVGPWYWGPAPFAIHARAGGLLDLQPIGPFGRGSRFRPVGEERWIGMDGYYAGETLRVRRDAGGRVVDLEVASFVLTRTPYDPAAGVPGGVDPAGWGPLP
jgi:CubicO group peptidase (beta-lactamase class C family)